MEEGILLISDPFVATASLHEVCGSRSGEIFKVGVGMNLEGVSIRDHAVSLIDQCGQNTTV